MPGRILLDVAAFLLLQVPILHWAPLRPSSNIMSMGCFGAKISSRFERPGMVSCDISVNNILAVVNSRQQKPCVWGEELVNRHK